MAKKHNIISQHVGAKLADYRRANNLTQQQIAEIIGLTRVSVLNIESGRHNITLEKMFMLCCLFKCQVSDLFPATKNINFKIQQKTITVKKKIRKIKIIK